MRKAARTHLVSSCVSALLLFLALPGRAEDKKKILFLAGRHHQDAGIHEMKGGCKLLARTLQENIPELGIVIHEGRWPKAPNAFGGVAAVVIYSGGSGLHPAHRNLEPLDAIMKKGAGLVCLHDALEVPRGGPGNHFLSWIGGYYETGWSVCPQWTADFKKLPAHPITRGVKPFSIHDEWHYNIRFRKDMEGVTPILTAISKSQPQHVAWARERPDGGRGFGFTGGHFHRNWGNENFRKLVTNAIVWAAGIEVPEKGVPCKPLTPDQLSEFLEEKKTRGSP